MKNTALILSTISLVLSVSSGQFSFAETAQKSAKAKSEETTKAQGGLQITDIKVGTGAEAKQGKTLVVDYLGTLEKTGAKFDSSYDRKEKFEFVLGRDRVIEGWQKGFEGMKEGGKRKLVIPASMGYGERGAPPVIPPNATLVFEVELHKVK